MATKLIFTSTIVMLLVGCQSNTTPTAERRAEAVREEADKAAREAKEEADRAKAALSKRLDQLDEEIDRLEAKAKKSTAKVRANMNAQAREARAEAKRLRARMSTWDDKTSSAWQTAKREIEEGLDKAENSIKKFVDKVKN